MRRPAAIAILSCLVAACGGTDENGATNNAATNNGSNAGTNNAATNNAGTNNAATNNGATNGTPETGMEVYTQRLEGGNTFTCATCHALTEPADDGITRPGHPIGDAFGRPSYKNGQITDLREAVNTCVTEWMVGDAFTEDDETWILLRDFLEEQSDGESEALTFEIAPPPADVSGGDPDAGLEVFNRSCAVCHGEGGGGTNKAPPVAGLELDPDYIAQRVRLSGASDSPTYDGLTGGRMPFWAPDRISDAELIDIVAYVADSEMVDPGNNINANPNNMNNTELRDCDSTHSKIGQTLQFSELFHDVSGSAEIVDDCTIEITDFTFDGGGIDVRIYAALGEEFNDGFAISDDLLSPDPYDGVTLTVQIPEDRSLDDLDSLSVWCVAAGQSFGHGTFQ